MTTRPGEPVAGADARQTSASLRRLHLSVLLVSLPFGLLVLGLPLIARELGASAVAIGGLFSIYSLIIVVLQPIVGHGLDRFGRRPFLIIGLLGFAFSNAVFGLASGVAGLYLAQVGQGVGAGLLWLAVLSVVSDLAPDDCRGEEYGRIEEMAFRGILLGSLVGFALLWFLSDDEIGGGLSLVGGWRILFLGFTAATLLATAMVWRGVPESLQRSADDPEETPAVPADQPVAPDEKWRLPGQLRVFLGIVILTAIAAEILSPVLMKYLNDNVSSNMFVIALAFLPAAIAGSVLPSRLGGLSDRFGRRPPLIIALLVGGLAALVVPFVQSLWPLASAVGIRGRGLCGGDARRRSAGGGSSGRRTTGHGVRVLHRRRRAGRGDRSAAGRLAVRPLRRSGRVRYQRAVDGTWRRIDFPVGARAVTCKGDRVVGAEISRLQARVLAGGPTARTRLASAN